MFLGIDIGTSAVKVVVTPAAGGVSATATAPLSVSSPHPLWSEQDPRDWWQATLLACDEARRSDPESWSRIEAIGLSGQMHGATVLDANRQPLRPAILWNDGRAVAECAEMERNFPRHGMVAGVPAMPGFTAPKILWLRNHEPAIYRDIAHILLPKDYVRLQMTGELATDMSDAAGTLWLDESARRWSDTLCEASATDPAWLPSLHEGTEIAGRLNAATAEAFGLPAGLPVGAGGGDAAMGAVGVGAVKSGDAFISLGTSGQLFIADEAFRPNPQSFVHAFAHAVPQCWFRMAVMLNGAAPLAWFSSISGADIPTLLEEARQASTERLPLFLPYLTGERSPHNDPYIRGTFVGLEGSTTRGEMARAVIDSIAYSFRDARDSLAEAGGEVEQAMAIGGGTRSPLVLQTIADALDLPLIRTSGAETGPAYGAARLAAVAVDALSLDELAGKPETEAVFEPAPDKSARHAERHGQYRKLYRALAPLAQPGAI